MQETQSSSLDAKPSDTPERVVAVAQPMRRPAEPYRADRAPAATANEPRKLIVGRGIAFSGDIGACDQLIVEGSIEARLQEGQRIDIAESGLFRGTAGVVEADIAGRFDGELTVSGRLIIRATGKVEGKIQYGELAVEVGGILEGEIRGIPAKEPASS